MPSTEASSRHDANGCNSALNLGVQRGSFDGVQCDWDSLFFRKQRFICGGSLYHFAYSPDERVAVEMIC